MKRANSSSIVLVALLLFGCGAQSGTVQEQGTKAVLSVGAPRLVSEATVLRIWVHSGASVPVPASQLPPGITALRPQEVRVTQQGIFVQRSKRTGWEEGVFIAFRGTMVETRFRGVGPLFSHIDDQVYWYKVEG